MITISHYPAKGFELTSSKYNSTSKAYFYVDIHDEVEDRLKPGETLTNEKALAIFEDIKTKSSIKAFFTHPAFIIPASLTGAALGAGLSVLGSFVEAANAVAGIALKVLGILIATACCAIFAFSMYSMKNNALLNLSHAYRDMGEKAAEYIQIIKKTEPYDVEFIL